MSALDSNLNTDTSEGYAIVYPEIYPSPTQLASLKLEIGDPFNPSNPNRRISPRVLLLRSREPGAAVNRCVKWGTQVHEREAIAMEYVRRNTTIPVPRVYWFYKDDTKQGQAGGKAIGYLVMEYIAGGTPLRYLEYRLSAAQRDRVVSQIQDYIQQLRLLGDRAISTSAPASPSRSASMGSWDPSHPSQPSAYQNVFYSSRDSSLQPTAPFTSLAELKAHWLLHWSNRPILGPPPPSHAIDVDPQTIPPTVFLSHADMGAHNILVNTNDHGSVAVVVDWDSFGWYPSFWEYAFSQRGSSNPAWKKAFEEVFPPMSIAEERFYRFINKAFSAHRDEF